MAYRKITVGGTTYEYVIGNSFGKIKIPGGGSLSFNKHSVGGMITIDCGCGDGRECPHASNKTAVTPKDVRRVIETYMGH